MQAPEGRDPGRLRQAVEQLLRLLGAERGHLSRHPEDLASRVHGRLRTAGWTGEEMARTFGFVTDRAAAEDPRRVPTRLALWLDEVVRLSTGSGGSRPAPPAAPITGVQWLDPDHALSAGADGSLHLWDLKDGRLAWSRRTHLDAVTGVVLVDPTEHLWATTSRDGTVALVQPGQEASVRLAGHAGPVLGAVEAPAEKAGEPPRFVTWSEDGTLRLWDPESRACAAAVAAHRGAVRAAVSVDLASAPWRWGLATGGDDGAIRLWQLAGPEGSSGDPVGFRLLAEAEAHRAPVTALRVLPASGSATGAPTLRLASGSEDTTVALWQAPDPTRTLRPPGSFVSLDRLRGHRLGVTALATVEPDRLVSASLDRTLVLWDLEQGELLERFEHHTGAVTACTVVRGELISVSADGTAGLRRLEGTVTPTPTAASDGGFRRLAGHRLAVRGFGYEPAGTRLLTASDDRTLRLWEWTSGDSIELTGRRPSWGRPVALGGSRLVCLAASSVRGVDVATGETGSLGPQGPFRGLAAGDGRRVAFWDESRLELWQESDDPGEPSLRPLASQPSFDRSPGNAAIDPSGEWVATWGDGEEITILRRDGDKLIRTWLFRSHTDRVSACRFLPDSPRLLSASWDGTLRLWHLDRPDFETLEGHTGRILACAIDATGRYALSAATDRTLRLWRLDRLEAMGVAGEMPELVTALAFGADGQAGAGSADGELIRLRYGSPAGRTAERRPAHEGPVHDLLYLEGHDGGAVLATCGDDGAVRTWDPDTGELVGTAWAEEPLRSLAWLPEVERLVAQDELGSLWSFRLAHGEGGAEGMSAS